MTKKLYTQAEMDAAVDGETAAILGHLMEMVKMRIRSAKSGHVRCETTYEALYQAIAEIDYGSHRKQADNG